MNVSVHRIRLDLNNIERQEFIKVRQDDESKMISAMLTEGITPYILTNDAVAILAAKKPNGTYLYTDCEISDNRINALLPDTFTETAQILSACFRLTGDDGAALATPAFTICIEAPAAPEET